MYYDRKYCKTLDHVNRINVVILYSTKERSKTPITVSHFHSTTFSGEPSTGLQIQSMNEFVEVMEK